MLKIEYPKQYPKTLIPTVYPAVLFFYDKHQQEYSERDGLLKKWMAIAVWEFVSCLSLSACAKYYVGRIINYDEPYWCKCSEFPTTCSQDYKDFVFEYTISRGDNAEKNPLAEYVLKGHAIYKGEGGFSHLATGGQFGEGSHFTFILVNDGVIIDYFYLNVMGDNLGSRLPFKKRFKSPPFDATAIDYDVYVYD